VYWIGLFHVIDQIVLDDIMAFALVLVGDLVHFHVYELTVSLWIYI
jgi:hypothetical protein